jgi:thioredoxin-related protein
MFKELIKQNKISIGIIACLLIFSAIIAYVFPIKSFFNKRNNNENNEFKPVKDELHLNMFHVDWCPHCKNALPKWNNTKNKFKDELVNGYSVKFTDINCTSEDTNVTELINKYGIDSFPTIIMLKKNGDVAEFDAAVTEHTLTEFIQANAV